MQEIKDETNTVHDVRPTYRASTDNDRSRHESQERRKLKLTRMPDCKYCGTQHAFRKEICPTYRKICSSCGKSNHFARVCQSSKRIHAANIASNPDSSNDEFFVGTINTQQQKLTVNTVGVDEWISELKVNGHAVKVKLDTGAMFDQIKANNTLQKSKTKIVSYGGHKMDVLGHTMLLCEYKDMMYVLRFYVIDSDERPHTWAKSMSRIESHPTSR